MFTMPGGRIFDNINDLLLHFSRYGAYYLQSMSNLPGDVLDEFLKGNHVMRHQEGIWNGIWSDMFIESTFMRYGHGPGGIIGITLNPKSIKRCALSLHLCSTLKQDLLSLVNGDSDKKVTKHKEEGASRIEADSMDRTKIREKLQSCIDPFDPESLDPDIVNIVSGEVADKSVNVDNSVSLGSKMMTDFVNSWPEGFNKTLSKK